MFLSHPNQPFQSRKGTTMAEQSDDARAIHLNSWQWQNVPESAREFKQQFHPRPNESNFIERIMPSLNKIIDEKLTFRQRQIIDLYYLQNKTQVEIAQRLGITQPTVSQHLAGRYRFGKKIGGAIRKIRKHTH
jgi:RNA polymerase sigma factor (sigma-70 family)